MATNSLTKVEPLHWPHYWTNPTSLQRFFLGFPIIGIDKRAHRFVSQQLRSRTPDVFDRWPENQRETAIAVASIVHEYLRWPNTYFVPEDPCAILLWDPTMEMRLEEAMLVLSDRYGLADAVFDQLPDMSFGELVSRIAAASEEASSTGKER